MNDITLPVNYNNLNRWQIRMIREEYIKQQAGICYYCGNPLDQEASISVMSRPINGELFPDRFFEWPIHLHHDRVTGMTIGAVHCRCNAVLWQYEGK